MTFVLQFLIFSVITMVSTIPLARVSKMVKRRHDSRKWAIAAVIVSFITAGFGWSSRSLETSCLQERNEGCIDIGGAGAQFLFVGGFVAWALISAYMKYNDY